MPIITPDFTEAVENTPVPDGIYKARITDAELKQSRGGQSMVNWKLTIFGADGDYAKQNNRPLFLTTMAEGKGAGMLKDFAKKVLGTIPSDWNTDQFLGKEIEVQVATRFNEDGTPSQYPNIKPLKAITN